jgi:hypothetical protein
MRKADVAGNPRLLAQWEAKQARRRARRLGQGPIPRGKEGASVKQVFEKVLEGLRGEVEANLTRHYTRLAAEMKELDGKCLDEASKIMDKKYDHYYKFSNPDHNFQYRCVTFGYAPVYIKNCSQVIKYLAPEVVKEKIRKTVAEDLKSMFDSYIAKQTEKVNGILKGRKATVSSSVSRNLEGYYKFALADGAKFGMQTQIVWKTSPKGKRFWQFPTTFHNAIKANGTTIKNPSEANLKKEL